MATIASEGTTPRQNPLAPLSSHTARVVRPIANPTSAHALYRTSSDSERNHAMLDDQSKFRRVDGHLRHSVSSARAHADASSASMVALLATIRRTGSTTADEHKNSPHADAQCGSSSHTSPSARVVVSASRSPLAHFSQIFTVVATIARLRHAAATTR